MTFLELIRKDGLYLKEIQNPTPELCLEAVRQDGRALQFVKDQTPELCLEAVKQTRWAQFIKDKDALIEYLRTGYPPPH